MFRIFMLTIKRNFRNLPITFAIIVCSLIMIGVLGNALEGMQEKGITFNESVAYMNALDGPYKIMLDELILDPKLSDVFQVTLLETEDEVLKGIEAGIYKTFVKAKENDGKQEIMVFSTNTQTPIKSIIVSFVDTANYAIKTYEKGESWSVLDDEESKDLFEKTVTDKGVPMGMDYYGIVSLLQSLIFGGLLGVFSVLEDYEKHIILRLKSAPISFNQIYFARIMANTLYLTFITFVIASASAFIFKVNWQGNYFIIFAAILLFSLIINGLGMLSAAITRSSGISIGIVVMALMIWSKPAGSFGPNQPITIYSYLSPNVYTKNAIFATIYGGSNQLLLQSFVGLILIGCFIYGLFFLARRFKNGHL